MNGRKARLIRKAMTMRGYEGQNHKILCRKIRRKTVNWPTHKLLTFLFGD